MSHSKIERQNIDIYQYPRVSESNADQLSIGDLHANAMLLMHFLVSTGIVAMKSDDYNKLKEIYVKNPNELEATDITEFNKIIDNLEINKKPLVRLIGDEVADRGQNDYFILKILDKLKKSGVKTEILLSNHGIEFLIPYEKSKSSNATVIGSAPNINFSNQADSLENMISLIEQGLISKQEIDYLVEESYLPSLKLISYSLESGVITIYSHAGIGLETIQALAKKFEADGVVYKDDTVINLARTIEAINVAFAAQVSKGQIHALSTNIGSGDVSHSDDPINFVLWNRKYADLSREQIHNQYRVYYVHGHDSGDPAPANVINLDHIAGKYLKMNKGSYSVLGVQDMFSLELAKLHTKSLDLEKRGDVGAANSANDLHRALKKAYIDWKKDDDYTKFSNTCNIAIKEPRPELQKHRGWSEFLANLVLAVATVGIGLLVKGVINKNNHRPFFFVHKTQSQKIVDDLQDSLTPISPSQGK